MIWKRKSKNYTCWNLRLNLNNSCATWIFCNLTGFNVSLKLKQGVKWEPTQFEGLYILQRLTQPIFTCSKLTIQTLKRSVKYVQSYNKDTRTTPLAGYKLQGLLAHLINKFIFRVNKNHRKVKKDKIFFPYIVVISELDLNSCCFCSYSFFISIK